MPAVCALLPRRLRCSRILWLVLFTGTAVIAWRSGTDRNSTARSVESQRLAAYSTPSAAGEPTTEQPSPQSSAAAKEVDPVPIAPVPEAVPRQLLLGAWEDHFFGRRVFVYRDDGTGSMTVEPEDPVSRALYGEKLTFQFTWTLHGDVMRLEMTGGEPQPAADTLSQLFGRTSERRVEHLDTQELRVRSLDSQKVYVHRRCTPIADE